jgi:hypothetical protein
MVDKPDETRTAPAIVGVGQASVDPASKAVGVGEVAPPFALPDTQGDLISLRDLTRSRQVVLVFYRGDW